MKRVVLSLMLCALAPVPAPVALAAETVVPGAPSADELLARIDANMTFDTRTTRATMTVTKPKREKVYELVSYGRGAGEGATEFLSPARDKGTRMLKKGDELWMYLPSVEKVQKLSGHMLRQGMMGSDMSYEDMMEAASWRAHYTAEVVGQEEVDGRACWVLELKARDESVSYPRRKVWVDAERLLPLRQELYALSGMLLKVWTMHDPVQYGARWYPSRFVIEDKLVEGSRTVIVFTEMKFSVDLEDEVFTMRWLER